MAAGSLRCRVAGIGSGANETRGRSGGAENRTRSGTASEPVSGPRSRLILREPPSTHQSVARTAAERPTETSRE
ncbi:MAG TPA: hypothetical protein DCQ98_21160 [Planctomycetaceae bacterium]|nr:hypothetical protein [Planctomycetaceae bacterium]